MKKFIFAILLVLAGAIFTNANAAVKTKTANILNSKVQLVPRYILFVSNGSWWLLSIYDNGQDTLTYVAPVIM